MAGARGCFNCGGCAWWLRVVVVAVVSPSRASCTDAACTYVFPPHPPFLPHSLTPLFFFSFLVVRGAVLTGTASSFFLYIAYISTRHNQKIHCSQNCMVVCIMTPPVLMSPV